MRKTRENNNPSSATNVKPHCKHKCCNNVNYVFRDTKTRGVRAKLIIALLGVLLILSGICGYSLGLSLSFNNEWEDPIIPPPPSSSKLHKFAKAAICTDALRCSDIGNQMLARNGSAVDAAVAAMFCTSMIDVQSVGMGGGHFMTVYIKAERKAYAVVGRERAPLAADVGMFKGKMTASRKGPLAIAVPGEVKGLWTAHSRWGVLPWAEILAPSIKICREGYPMASPTRCGLKTRSFVINDSHMRKTFYNEKTKTFYDTGTMIYPPKEYCRTLERLAEEGGDSLYNGSLARDLADDFKKAGSIITARDLAEYRANIVDPIEVPLGEYKLIIPPPPSSGVLLAYILNILSGYNLSPASVETPEKTTLTYHRMVEAFKYAFATRTKLGDRNFLELDDLIKNMTSVEYGEATRKKIDDVKTSNFTEYYGADQYTKDDAGTAQMSIIAPNGDAVSVTSSINSYFGCGLSGAKTGIIFNNAMDDFGSPGLKNSYGVEPATANFIAPWKMPLSSMAPSIIIDDNGNVRLVIGASGATMITTSIALVIIRKLWLEQTLKEAVDAPRIHHQLIPMTVQYEYGATRDMISGLREKGHGVTRYRAGQVGHNVGVTGYSAGSLICALYRNETAIYGNADYRKGGHVCGL